MIHPERSFDMFPIVGTASSGKSTLLAAYGELHQNDPQTMVLEEGARVFFERNPEVLEGQVHVLPVQKRIQDFVFQREVEAVANSDATCLVTDRSVIDPVVLTHFYGDAEGADQLLENVQEWVPQYTVFLLADPQGIPYEKDPLRRETPEERLAIHDAFQDFFEEHDLSYRVISGSVSERLVQVEQTIFEYKKTKAIIS